jgi:hypothetical protein
MDVTLQLSGPEERSCTNRQSVRRWCVSTGLISAVAWVQNLLVPDGDGDALTLGCSVQMVKEGKEAPPRRWRHPGRYPSEPKPTRVPSMTSILADPVLAHTSTRGP